ncbi:MAG: hypothetical protein ACE15C_03980 [Phycisphaerae bacterium]
MKIVHLAVAVALAGLCIPYAAGQDNGKDEFLKLADKLMDEAQRQHSVNQRMDNTIATVALLIADLKSNDLLQGVMADEMQRITNVLGKLSTEHVPNAAKYLEAAKARLESLKTGLSGPELSSADKEIKFILKELERLLTKADTFQSDEDLLTELRIIIQKQDVTMQDTAKWAKQLVADPTSDGKKDELAPRQSDLAKNVEHFHNRLKEARDSAEGLDKIPLEQAFTAMARMNIEAEMTATAKDILDKKPIAAVGQQKTILEQLREIEKMLMADDLRAEINQLEKEKADLEQLLKEQQELRQKTEKSDLNPEQRKDLQNQQHDLEKKTQKVQEENKEVNPPEADKKLDAARQDMKNAEKKIEEPNKKDAVAEQKQAEKDLSDAIEAVNRKLEQDEQQREDQTDEEAKQDPDEKELQQIEDLTKEQERVMDQTQQTAPKEMGKLEGQEEKIEEKSNELKVEQAQQEAHEAAQDMHQGKKEEAIQHEQNVIKALKEKGNKLKDKLARKRMKMHDPEKKDPDPEGKRESTRKPAAPGMNPEGDAKWTPMTPREREALYQKYQRELPPEYKELLENYYEALSK